MPARTYDKRSPQELAKQLLEGDAEQGPRVTESPVDERAIERQKERAREAVKAELAKAATGEALEAVVPEDFPLDEPGARPKSLTKKERQREANRIKDGVERAQEYQAEKRTRAEVGRRPARLDRAPGKTAWHVRDRIRKMAKRFHRRMDGDERLEELAGLVERAESILQTFKDDDLRSVVRVGPARPIDEWSKKELYSFAAQQRIDLGPDLTVKVARGIIQEHCLDNRIDPGTLPGVPLGSRYDRTETRSA
jgi:hypothetical protein